MYTKYLRRRYTHMNVLMGSLRASLQVHMYVCMCMFRVYIAAHNSELFLHENSNFNSKSYDFDVFDLCIPDRGVCFMNRVQLTQHTQLQYLKKP